jgi:hypothetical protein
MLKILQINYKMNASIADFLKESAPVANFLANVTGLRWKIWLMNETEREGGGVYLFDNDASLNAFLEGPIIAKLKNHPNLKELIIKRFDVPVSLSEITRGPIKSNATV